MISRIYEISCDNCGEGQHYHNTRRISEQEYIHLGGIITRQNKHFCVHLCYKMYRIKEAEAKAVTAKYSLCPVCKKHNINESDPAAFPAISRKDNKTRICTGCSLLETAEGIKRSKS